MFLWRLRVVAGSMNAGVKPCLGLARGRVADRIPGVPPRSAAHPGLCTDGLPGRRKSGREMRVAVLAQSTGAPSKAPLARSLRDRGYMRAEHGGPVERATLPQPDQAGLLSQFGMSAHKYAASRPRV